ncbi:hypothetical protein U9M48_002935 [Paspalum notatum var. saurae]|uniref:Uncharacterized protein n=1 Tax=Paspalum notatum var. saurae TaxID=547442 RepID=A0AAQ3SK89_PASNO
MPMKMGRRWTEGISRDDRLTSYSTATGADIRFAVRLCARYRASPRTSYRQAVKRIFRLQVESVDNALIKGEIESQWTGLIALLV